MSEMKDSCIKWIGKIPIEWSTKRVKYLATKPESLFIDGDWIESYVIIEKGIRYLTTGNVGAGFFKEQGSGYISEETFKKLKCLKVLPGDLMISRLNEPIGRACIVPDIEDFYVVAVDNVILRPNKEFDKKFIMYCMNTTGYSEDANDAARGSTMQRVSRSILGTFIIPITSIEEQKNIVKFLDNKVGKIDEILTFLYNQISILNKYKQSLITEVVTKGLNNNAKMKDSGIDWIGEIPEHWIISKLKYISKCNESTLKENTKSDLYMRYIDIGSVSYDNGIEIYQEMKFEDSPSRARRIVKKGNIIISTVRTYLKAIAFIEDDENVIVSTGFAVIRLNDAMYNKYFYYYIKSEKFIEQVDKYSYGIAYPAINAELLNSILTIIPTVDEQKKIADYLDKKCKEIDDLIKNKRAQIDKMEQYKKSLIYEYVTGKKRVKGAEELYG